MARIEKENLIGKHLVWKGEFDLGSNFIPAIFCTNRKNDFIVEDNGIEIQVSLTAKANTKEISLMASKKIEYVELSKLLFDLLKYENLFDGRFYSIHELSLDGIDIMAIIIEEWLPYYRSKKAYTYICINYDNDDEYKDLFLKWKDMCQELDIIHQMFLYACYSTDITPDVKLALLLQTFEPIADKLYDKGVINLVKPPYIGKSAPCDSCGNIVCVNIKNKNLHFSERLQAIVDKYRTGIFDNDKIDILLKKAVNLRNKIVHLDATQQETLSGKESGVYIYIFSLLYRKVIFSELELDSSGYSDIIADWIKDFDKRYGNCMILEH